MKKYVNIWTSLSLAILTGFTVFIAYNYDQNRVEKADTLYQNNDAEPIRDAKLIRIYPSEGQTMEELLDSLQNIQ